MFSVGVLAFLFVDVFEHAFGIVEESVERLQGRRAGLRRARSDCALLLGAGFAAGTAGLAVVERWMRPDGEPGPPADRGRLERRDDDRAGGGDLGARPLSSAPARSGRA